MSVEDKKTFFAWNSRMLIVLGAIAAIISFTGCGQFANTNSARLATATVTVTHTLNSGIVTLQTDRTSYQSNDTISAILKNQSNQIIYFPDHLTDCSVILLQRLPIQLLSGDSGQTGINPCRSEIVTRMHSLAAGQTLVVKLLAPSTDWLPGVYRAILTYNTSLKQPKTIYTAAFTVGPFTPQP